MLIGIVGRTNTGKSTLFKALTLAEVEIENRPFVTLKPNHGVGYVKINCVDKDFNLKCNAKEGYCLSNYRFVPVELLDVAGLIKDAHKGAGLGLEFLNDLSQADCLIEVIDISGGTNDKGEEVSDYSYDPREDILMLEGEIDQWFFKILKKDWSNFIKKVEQEKKNLIKEISIKFSGLKIKEEDVKEVLSGVDIKKWDDENLLKFSSGLRRKSKPLIIACNKIDMDNGLENFKRLKKEFKDHTLIPCSAESELALREANKKGLIEYIPGEKNFKIIGKLNEKQEKGLEFIKKKVLDEISSTGVQEVLNTAVFDLLRYIAVYPVANNKLEDKDGNVLPNVILVPEGVTALEFASRVHTDFSKNFIKAVDLKSKKIIGKESKLKNLDVVEIITK